MSAAATQAAPSVPTLPPELIVFLEAYPHPALIFARPEDDSDLGASNFIRPLWTNKAFSAVSLLPPNERVRWQRVYANAITRTLTREAEAATGGHTVAYGAWTFVVTRPTPALLVVTTSLAPRHDRVASDEPETAQVSMSVDVPAAAAALPLRLRGDPLAPVLQRSVVGRLILAYPWDRTALGPLDRWDHARRQLLCMTMLFPGRIAVWLRGEDGREHGFYNDEYIAVLNKSKHPRGLGVSFQELHPELWFVLEQYTKKVYAGETVFHIDNMLLMDREKTSPDDTMDLQETYHIWCFVPLYSGKEVIGFLNHSFETTDRVYAARQLGTLRIIHDATTLTRTTPDFLKGCMAAIAQNALDLPFALLYTVKPTPSVRVASTAGLRSDSTVNVTDSSPRARLELFARIGVPEGHPCAPESIEVSFPEPVSGGGGGASLDGSLSDIDMSSLGEPEDSGAGHPWPFAQVLGTRRPALVAHLSDALADCARRGWDKPSGRALAVPVGASDSTPDAVLILGLNPCRPYDEDYKAFMRLLSAQMSTGLMTVQNYETAKQKADELASLDRAKTVFFGNVSHELRTPLTLILGPLEDLLSKHDLLGSTRQSLAMVMRNAQRLHALVNSLLDFARLEAGRYLASFRPVNLSTFTADLASLFRSAIERGGVKLDVLCEADARQVWLDQDFWEKVVVNLLSNAFKYCLHGRIEIRVWYSATDAFFSCSDTGCGIPESELDNIFKRFHRVESTGRSHEGTGIGLALTYETVKALGGRLGARSQVGRGSTFTVTLPLGSDHIPAERKAGDSESHDNPLQHANRYGMRKAQEAHTWLSSDSSGAPTDSERAESGVGDSMDARESTKTRDDVTLEGSTIVVADDNADLRHYCESLLSRWYTVKSFSDGQAALEYTQRNQVDMVMSDVQMPRLDGFGFLRAVRSQPSTSLLPFILLSAKAGSEARAEGLNAGADDYLVKPFSSRELMARVKTHLDAGRMRRDLEARVQDRTRLLVESEARLQQKVAESEHMRQQQAIVVDLTSHEMRNPLNAIWQNAELVETSLEQMRTIALAQRARQLSQQGVEVLDRFDQILQNAEEAVESIILSVAHQARIADDILNFSKISMSLLTIHPIAFHLFDAVQDVCRMWEIEAKERLITLDYTCPSDLKELWIISDPLRCCQIIINFLTNAIRFTSESVIRKITVFVKSFHEPQPPEPNAFRIGSDVVTRPASMWIMIGVKDTGPGLTSEEVDRIFERFAQAHPSKDQFSGGHGLGLFVSRHLVMLLDGFIEVQTVRGEGSTFAFCIPVECAEPQADHDRSSRSWRARILGRRPTQPTKKPAPPLPQKTRHVLVVEDNLINQKVLIRQLEGKGFRTTVASDGQEALDKIREGRESHAYDVVLMDIEMPVKDGKTACRELREEETSGHLPRLPVIAVTGNAREEQIQECLDGGFDEVAIKPYRITDVVRLIDSVLSVTF